MITLNQPCLILLVLMVAVLIIAAFVGRATRMAARSTSRKCIACMSVCLLFPAAFTPVATATEPVFTSPKGFTITPPDGWTLFSKDAAREKSDAVKKAFPKFDSANLDRMAAMLMNPADSGITNINVVVVPSRIPINDSDAEQKLGTMLREQYTKMGASLGKFTAVRKTFGTHKALVADFESNMGGAATRQWQVMMPAGSQTLIVTCTSKQSTFDQFTPVFTKAIETMAFSDKEFPAWLRYGIIGGVVGGLIGLFRKFMASRKKA